MIIYFKTKECEWKNSLNSSYFYIVIQGIAVNWMCLKLGIDVVHRFVQVANRLIMWSVQYKTVQCLENNLTVYV